MVNELTQLHDDENIKQKEGFELLKQFNDDSEKENFIRKCYQKEKTRWMWNRLKWFVKLSDRQCYDSVKIFFLTAMAETNIKLSEGRFEESSKSTEDIKKFYGYFSVDDRQFFENNFYYPLKYGEIQQRIHFNNIIEILLNVRHRVVHGKNHYDFIFPKDGNCQPTQGELNKQPFLYELRLTYNDYKMRMIKYALMNIENNL